MTSNGSCSDLRTLLQAETVSWMQDECVLLVCVLLVSVLLSLSSVVNPSLAERPQLAAAAVSRLIKMWPWSDRWRLTCGTNFVALRFFFSQIFHSVYGPYIICEGIVCTDITVPTGRERWRFRCVLRNNTVKQHWSEIWFAHPDSDASGITFQIISSLA